VERALQEARHSSVAAVTMPLEAKQAALLLLAMLLALVVL
jgi:hypothetical protein